jgi:hypothetical protein
VALVGFAVSSVSAQTVTPPAGSVRQALKARFAPAPVAPPAVKPSFNLKSTRNAITPVAPQTGTAKKPFWKTPWPYVILVGAAGGVYYAAKGLGGGGGEGGY